jgi:hypothetical protein
MFTIYYDARELETLSGFALSNIDRPKTVEAVAQCLATLTVLQSIIDTLLRVPGEFLAVEFCQALVKSADTIFSNAFPNYPATDLESVSNFCLDQTGTLLT